MDPAIQALLQAGELEDWQVSYARSLGNTPEYQFLNLTEILLKLGYTSEERLQGH